MKAFCLALSICISCTVAAQEPAFSHAVLAYRAGDWSSAYGRFAVLATNGNGEAARIALFMQKHGPLLYGSRWDASNEDIELWSRLAGTRAWRADDPDRVASLAPHKANALRPRMQRFIGRSEPAK